MEPNTDINTENLSTDELRNALAQGSIEPQPEQEPIDSSAPTAEEPVTPEETEAPATEEPEKVETEAEQLAKMRIRPRNSLDQQVIDLYKSEGFNGTFADATAVIYRQNTLQPSEQPAVSKPEEPAKENPIQTLESEIKALQAQMLEAADNLETAKALQIQQQIYDKKLDVRQMQEVAKKVVETRQQEQMTTFRQKAEASRDAVLDRFPVLKNTDSVERKALDAFIVEKQHDPDYAVIFQSPKWPELIAQEFANGSLLKAAASPTSPKTLNNPTAPVSKAKVLTSGVTTSTTSQSPEALLKDMSKMSTKDLMSLLGSSK
jgi:hypothetical protein